MAGLLRNIGEPLREPKTHCYRIIRGTMQRFLYLNEAGTGYVVSEDVPEFPISIYAAREILAFSRAGSIMFGYLNVAGTGLSFSATYPVWASRTTYFPQLSEPVFRDGLYRWLYANSALTGLVISEEPYPQ